MINPALNPNPPSRRFGVVNYEDPNYNVGMPVFSIHGVKTPATRLGSAFGFGVVSQPVPQRASGALTEPCRSPPTPTLLGSPAGNHDDPSGTDNLAALDILATCNLVNYFGKTVRCSRSFTAGLVQRC
jgi:double-strand break repair protein MRE11